MGSGEAEQLGHGGDATLCEEYTLTRPRLLKALARIPLVRLAVGGMHTLGLEAGGRVWSWGCNDDSALGRGGAENRPGLVRGGLEGIAVVALSAGDSHSCALDVHGRVYSWGTYKGADGYLGFDARGEVKKQDTPLHLGALGARYGPAVAISSGSDHTGCITASGRALVWGYGGQGQLGRIARQKDAGASDEEVLSQLDPSPIPLSRVWLPAAGIGGGEGGGGKKKKTKSAASPSAAAVSGTQDGLLAAAASLLPLPGLGTVMEEEEGGGGEEEEEEQEEGASKKRSRNGKEKGGSKAPTARGAVVVAAAVKAKGASSKATPAAAPGSSKNGGKKRGRKDAEAEEEEEGEEEEEEGGGAVALGSKKGGKASSSIASSSASRSSSAKSSAAGAAAAPSASSAVWDAVCRAPQGKLPTGEQPVAAIFAVGYSTFLLSAPDHTNAGGSNLVYACGLNSYGQLGVGHSKDLSVPTLVADLSGPSAPGGGVVSMAGGSQHTVALLADGGVLAWGRGDSGQLGLGRPPSAAAGSASSSSIAVAGSAFRPRQVALPEAAVSITANTCCSAALSRGGTLFTWGYGESGALGNGGGGDENAPFQVNTSPTPFGGGAAWAGRKGEDLEGCRVVAAGMGGQHLVLVAHVGGKGARARPDVSKDCYAIVTDPPVAVEGEEEEDW